MVKRKWLGVVLPNAARIGFALVLGAYSGPVQAQLTIDTDRTTPVATSEAPVGEELIVDTAGSIAVTEEAPIITIDTDNDVIIESGAVLTNSAGSNAIGIEIDLENNRALDLDFRGNMLLGEIDPDIALGSNNMGLIIGRVGDAGTFTGNISTANAALFRVEGDDSIGIAINREVIGNFDFGQLTVSGENAQGIVSTAAITGQMQFRANIVAQGTGTPSFTARDSVSGNAVAIGASIITELMDHDDNVLTDDVRFGGIQIDGPRFILDNRGTGQARTFGGAPAFYISPTVAGVLGENIKLGFFSDLPNLTEDDPETLDVDETEVDPAFDADNGIGFYSFINRGIIRGEGLEPGNDTEGFRIEGSCAVAGSCMGVDDKTVTFSGGLFNQNGIGSEAVSHNLFASDEPAAASDSTALIIGNGAIIPTFVNEGTVTAQTQGSSVGGSEGGTAIGILIEEGGSLPSITNNSSINGIVTTNLSTELTNLEAFGIVDLSDTLGVIDNSGFIRGLVSETSAEAAAVAIDVSASTIPVTVTNRQLEGDIRAAEITGDLRFGSSQDNLLIIDGHVTDDEGVVERAFVDGNVSAVGGVDINIFDGTLTTNGSSASNIVVGSTDGADDNKLAAIEFLLGDGPSPTPIVTTSGNVTFFANSSAKFSSLSFIGVDGVYSLLSAAGGITFDGTDLDSLVAFDSPFLFDSEFVLTGVTDLALSLERKTAAALGLGANNAAIYEPALQAAIGDDFIGQGLLSITDAGGVEEALNSLQPNIGAGARALSIAVTDSIGGPIGRRQRSLISSPEQGLRFWGQQFYQDLNAGTTATSSGYFGSGAGVSVGMEWGQSPVMRYGISYTYFAGQVTESNPRTTKENLALNIASAYASWRSNGLFVTPQVNVGYASYDNRRRAVAGPITRRAISDWNSFLTSGGVTSGYVVDLGAFQIVPHVSLDGLYIYDSGYTERQGGEGVNLTVGSRTTRSLRIFAGVLAQTEFTFEDGVVRPQLLAGWSQDLVNEGPVIDASFEAAPGSEFSVVGPVTDSSRLIGGASLGYLFENWSAAFNYDAAHTSGAFAQSASISMTSRF